MVLPAAYNFFGEWEYAWLPMALMAVMVAITFNITLMMFGRAFSIRELEAFAKSEMLQAGATALMAIFLVSMVGSAMEVSTGLLQNGTMECRGTTYQFNVPQSAMDQAYLGIRCRLQQRAIEVAGIQDAMTTGAGTWAEFNTLNMAVSIFGITTFKGDWVGELYRRTETTRITNNLATVLLIGLNAQSMLMEYLRLNMLTVFIPVGILLRSFYFTRSAGALFIALGVGMYFIFPIFFILLDPGFVPSSGTYQVLQIPIQQPYCYATMTNSISVLAAIENAGVGSTASLTTAGMRDDLSKSYISLILHPLVAFFLTMIFIRYMMSVLGGDTYELTKMISKVI
ncbi:hypothetical protein JXA56_05270 [Candidatus Micrarchaeota archaeon]|nr:hypothetical protein [Candidatus Micrarchaeota archaeon]